MHWELDTGFEVGTQRMENAGLMIVAPSCWKSVNAIRWTSRAPQTCGVRRVHAIAAIGF